MIEPIIYARLTASATLAALTSDRIYPTIPTAETPLPMLVYTVTGSEPVMHLGGDSGLCSYTLQIDSYAVTIQEVLDIAEEVRQQMHGQTWDTVQAATQTARSTTDEEYGHHCSQAFSIWASDTAVVPSVSIPAGSDAVYRLLGLRDELTSTLVDDAEVQGELEGGYLFALTHTSGGDYRGTIPGSQTIQLDPGTYTVTITAVAGDQEAVFDTVLTVR